MVTTDYRIALSVDKSFRAAVASDVHASPEYEQIIRLIAESEPDMILIPGDLCHYCDELEIPLKFLRAARDIAPVLYSFGNHERRTDEAPFRMDGVTLLNDSATEICGITVGGLRSGFRGQAESSLMETPEPDLAFLDSFGKIPGVKFLLCHHPEYYPRYLRDRSIDLILAGHAHGGQWRFFGRGLFAPGQWLFPKYTSGIIDGRMIVSRGLANTVAVPRLFNEPELVVVDVVPQKG